MNDLLIKTITDEVLKQINDIKIPKSVKVGISARHVHLSNDDLQILFGKNYSLTEKKKLMGDQFAAQEFVSIIGKNLRSLEKVRILGPTRKETQVEISSTDSRFLGVNAPIRLSGDIKNSESITIVGPKGAIKINEGCIVSKRHIHMHPDDANKYKLSEGVVSVRVLGERGGILENVDVRIREDFHLEMHIDTDEANALGIKNGESVEILL